MSSSSGTKSEIAMAPWRKGDVQQSLLTQGWKDRDHSAVYKLLDLYSHKEDLTWTYSMIRALRMFCPPDFEHAAWLPFFELFIANASERFLMEIGIHIKPVIIALEPGAEREHIVESASLAFITATETVQSKYWPKYKEFSLLLSMCIETARVKEGKSDDKKWIEMVSKLISVWTKCDIESRYGSQSKEKKKKKKKVEQQLKSSAPRPIARDGNTFWEEEVQSNNKALNMMRDMGWSIGSGLGKKKNGIAERVKIQILDQRAGLGFGKKETGRLKKKEINKKEINKKGIKNSKKDKKSRKKKKKKNKNDDDANCAEGGSWLW